VHFGGAALGASSAAGDAHQRKRLHGMQDRVRGHRIEAARLALPLWSCADLDQSEEPGQPGNGASVGRVKTRRFPAPWSILELEQSARYTMPPAELPDSSDMEYYNRTRTHLSLDKDAPVLRAN